MNEQARPGERFDGARLAVMTSRLQSVVRAMANTLFRTARSGVLNTGSDLSCCVITGDDRLLAAAESLPIHVMSGPDLMAKAIKELHGQLRPGDAFLHNSPYHGNSHPADYSILVPVFDDEKRHRFTVLAKGHQADCGCAAPTTYMAAARDVYAEGALIFPATQIQRDYQNIDDIIRLCMLRIRVPEQWWGDYLALLGAARIGERRIKELANEVGWDALDAYAEAWFDYGEQRMSAAIRKLPRGRITTRNAHDPFPGVPEGIPIQVTVEVRPDEATIEVDLRDNPDCQPCGLNLSEATARSAALIGIFNSIDHTVPANAGSFRRVKIQLRENCVVGIPRHPASCSVATTNLADKVTNATQRALAELADGIGMAEVGDGSPPAKAVISGRDPRQTDAPFMNQIFLANQGGAAGPHGDGWLTIAHVGNGGMMRRDSVEVDEARYPIRVHAQHIRPDSEGAGRFRGAPGSYVEYGPLGAPLEVMFAADCTVHPPLGTRGGQSGAPADQLKRLADGTLEPLPPCAHVVIQPGETIVSYACGGGGYGPPRERDPERVRHDVAEGWITRQRAEQVYGVVLDDQSQIDQAATAARRQSDG